MDASDHSKPRVKAPDAELESARQMLERARWASAKLLGLDASKVRRIVEALGEAGFAKAKTYAEWAVRETGYGVIEHKRIKNEACSRGLAEFYRDEDFVSPRIDAGMKMVELPRPAGVIFALIPVTNPIATVYFKTILALMTRNAIVISPHPGAKACCADAARTLAEAAKTAGAPDGAIQVLAEPKLPIIEAMMSDPRVDLIVATGGPAVVKAAYRSGNPAFGVGPGNAPVLVDATADLKLAAQRIVESKSFDNSILCTNESTVIAIASIADGFLDQMRAARAHVCTKDETERLRGWLFPDDRFNGAAIGKDASWIARQAGFNAPNAKILVAPVDLVQPEEPLVREKLCPVLGFARVPTLDQAFAAARSMTRRTGRGHSAAVHSKSERTIMAFAAAVPALRVAVNVGCSLGAAGYETYLSPSMTIGTGFIGGSSIGDNLAPHHLVQFSRIAYNKAASEKFGQFEGLDPTDPNLLAATHGDRPAPLALVASGNLGGDALRQELRKIILEELSAVLAA